jgi:hypothetical protein
MKRILLFVALLIPFLSAQAQIKVISSGYVGINNTSPTYQLDVSGNFRVGNPGSELIFNYGELYSSNYSLLGSSSYPCSELYAKYAYLWYMIKMIQAQQEEIDLPKAQVSKL